MKASFIYSFSALLLIVWIAEGRWLEKIRKIQQSKICLAFVAYYSVFILAMLWTENRAAGWHMVGRQMPVLLFLLYWSSAEMEYRERYISAFLAGLSICAVLAFYNWAHLYWFPEWPRGIQVFKSPGDTAPFVDRIMYAPLLALGAYFSLRRALLATSMTMRMVATAVTVLLVVNLSFSGGRAGAVMFLALCIALAFEELRTWRKSLVLAALFLPLVFLTAYSTQNYFAERVNLAITDIQAFPKDPNTSVGLRFVYWTTSFRLFANHPLGGVGSGDFQDEYTRIKPEQWKTTPNSYNPHNQFLLTAATTGLIGLIALLSIFYFSVFSSKDRRIRTVLLGFAVVWMFESYLWRSNTALAFSVILAVLLANNSRAVES